MIAKDLWMAIAGISLLGCTNAHAFQNEPNGFRDIAWGTPIAQVRNEMVVIPGGPEDAPVKFYERRGDLMKIGEAYLSELVYEFYKGRFAGVRIATTGIGDQQALIRAFSAQFGVGDQPNQSLDHYLWSGSFAEIYIKCDSASHDCDAFIGSTRIAAEERADHDAAARAGNKDF